jgi:hypothetical protein
MRTLPLCLLLALAAPSVALANDVGFGLDHKGRLSITGDADGNEIEVKYDPATNSIVIEGKNGTTVRGAASGSVPLPADPDSIPEITVSPGLGDDKVTIDLSGLPESQRPEKVTVEEDNGGGDDTTTLKNVQVAGRRGTIALKPGSGNDTTVVDGCDATAVNVRDRVGDNSITVKNCNVDGTLTIEPSAGKNTVEVMDTFYQDSIIRPKGLPTVEPSLEGRIQRTQGKKISFSGTDGADDVSFEDNVIEQASVKLGDGDDRLAFSGSTIDKLGADGGAGELDCLDQSGGGNVFASFKEKGFEPLECLGVELEFFAPGSNPFVEPPENAVAWKVQNGGHEDGPFALPGAENPFGLPVLDPASLPPPAHWGQGTECVAGMVQLHHIHDEFEGHADPDDEGCGHGILLWGELVPVM